MTEVNRSPGSYLVCPRCDDGRRHDPPEVYDLEGPIPCPDCGAATLYYDDQGIALCTGCRHHASACQCGEEGREER